MSHKTSQNDDSSEWCDNFSFQDDSINVTLVTEHNLICRDQGWFLNRCFSRLWLAEMVSNQHHFENRQKWKENQFLLWEISDLRLVHLLADPSQELFWLVDLIGFRVSSISLVKNFLVVSTRYLRKYSVRQRFSHFRDHVIHFYKLHFLKLILSNQNESFLVESNVTNRKSGIQVCLKWNFEKISTPKMPISNSDHVVKMLTWSYHALY